MGRQNLPALTSIRFFAAFWVVIFHVLTPLDKNWPVAIRNIIESGFVGVPLFFILSGFILAYTYILPSEDFSPRQFWVARFARIYPMHFVAFAACMPIYLWAYIKHSPIGDIRSSLVATPLLIHAWYPNW